LNVHRGDSAPRYSLQCVIAAWDGLPAAIRTATLALIGSQHGN
jgi:hypothetical protein